MRGIESHGPGCVLAAYTGGRMLDAYLKRRTARDNRIAVFHLDVGDALAVQEGAIARADVASNTLPAESPDLGFADVVQIGKVLA